MEPVGPQLREFLAQLGFDYNRLDITASYARNDKGELIGTIVIKGPIEE